MGFLGDMVRGLEEGAHSISHAVSRLQSSQDHGEQSVYRSSALRKRVLADHHGLRHTRVPDPFHFSQHTALLSFLTLRTVLDAGGLKRLGKGTQILVAATCLPFCIPGGLSLQTNGLSPFMVLEHRQLRRLISSIFLHQDLDHLLGNVSNLVVSGSYLERRMSTERFAATVLSLTASSQTLYGKHAQSRFC